MTAQIPKNVITDDKNRLALGASPKYEIWYEIKTQSDYESRTISKLPDEIAKYITSVSVNETDREASVLEITFGIPETIGTNNSTGISSSSPIDRDFLKIFDLDVLRPGQHFFIYMGYDNFIKFIDRFRVVGHKPNFPEGGKPSLTVIGYNGAWRIMELDAIKKVYPQLYKVYNSKAASEEIDAGKVVKIIAEHYKFRYDIEEKIYNSRVSEPLNNSETIFQYLVKLAESGYLHFYFRYLIFSQNVMPDGKMSIAGNDVLFFRKHSKLPLQSKSFVFKYFVDEQNETQTLISMAPSYNVRGRPLSISLGYLYKKPKKGVKPTGGELNVAEMLKEFDNNAEDPTKMQKYQYMQVTSIGTMDTSGEFITHRDPEYKDIFDSLINKEEYSDGYVVSYHSTWGDNEVDSESKKGSKQTRERRVAILASHQDIRKALGPNQFGEQVTKSFFEQKSAELRECWLYADSKIIGVPYVRLGDVHKFSGISTIYNGYWKILRIEHRIDNSGYFCNCFMKKLPDYLIASFEEEYRKGNVLFGSTSLIPQQFGDITDIAGIYQDKY